MPAREESRLTALLWSAAEHATTRLSQQEIDEILGVKASSDDPQVPDQRTAPDPESWTRIRTDAGDQRWLNHIYERHCQEQC